MKKIFALVLAAAMVLTLAACGKACEDITLSKDEITFTKEGQTKGIKVTTDPRDTSDEVEFESADEDVATVNEDGLVRAEGPGETTITVRCGDAVAYCEVICDFDGGNSDRDDDDGGNGEDIDTPTSNEPDCDTCGDTGLCPECEGNYKCTECDGSGDCGRCDGKGKITCRSCNGEPETCRICHGDGYYTESELAAGDDWDPGESYTSDTFTGNYGDWDDWEASYECEECVNGKYCPKCEATGVEDCPDCDRGYCPECDGDKIVCDECDKGKCPDCR